MADMLLRCVPDPQNGPGVSPCPPGMLVTTVEAQLPVVVSIDDWSTYAASASTGIILIFFFGFLLGTIGKHLKDAVR